MSDKAEIDKLAWVSPKITTVGDLIAALDQFRPDTRVVTSGFDSTEFDDISPITVERVIEIAQTGHGPKYVTFPSAYAATSEQVDEPFDAVVVMM